MQGFQNKIAQVVTMDGRNVKFVDSIDYVAVDGTRYRIPRGADSDGISSPAASWPVRPPFGQDWLAGVLHDCAYRNTLLIVTELGETESTRKSNLTKEQCDNLLREAAISLGDSAAIADALYYGVREFGWRAFNEDRE